MCEIAPNTNAQTHFETLKYAKDICIIHLLFLISLSSKLHNRVSSLSENMCALMQKFSKLVIRNNYGSLVRNLPSHEHIPVPLSIASTEILILETLPTIFYFDFLCFNSMVKIEGQIWRKNILSTGVKFV